MRRRVESKDKSSIQTNQKLIQGGLFSEETKSPALIEDSITVTGSRDIDRETGRIMFFRHLTPLLGEGRIWFLGGARGIDEWATEWLVESGETCRAVVPFTKAEQPRSVQVWLDKISEVVELRLPHSKSAYIVRNRYMVDRSALVIGFWSGKPGGTLSTLEYALRNGKEVRAIPVTTVDGDG